MASDEQRERAHGPEPLLTITLPISEFGREMVIKNLGGGCLTIQGSIDGLSVLVVPPCRGVMVLPHEGTWKAVWINLSWRERLVGFFKKLFFRT